MSKSQHLEPTTEKVVTFDNPADYARSIRATALVFEDPKSREIQDRMQRLSQSDATVLIIGETGTGKELVARQLHRLSQRRNGPFIAVNCAALPENLVESELFGYEKGAFTGAVGQRKGWFESASGGTLFLDEVGDLPLATQVKILRVLQEREVSRVGSRSSIPIDIRFLAAIEDLNVRENIETALIYRSLSAAERRARVDEVLERLGLPDISRDLPQQLSGGQQQRVAIARALVSRPQLVLADEPTGNLDTKTGGMVMDLLIDLVKQGITVVMATHALVHANRADRTIELLDGRITGEFPKPQ